MLKFSSWRKRETKFSLHHTFTTPHFTALLLHHTFTALSPHHTFTTFSPHYIFTYTALVIPTTLHFNKLTKSHSTLLFVIISLYYIFCGYLTVLCFLWSSHCTLLFVVTELYFAFCGYWIVLCFLWLL